MNGHEIVWQILKAFEDFQLFFFFVFFVHFCVTRAPTLCMHCYNPSVISAM